jgi:hypothetical protein
MAKSAVPGPLLRAIEAATSWLDAAQVPAALVGGIAASLLGRPRVTKDVDFVALADESVWPELLALGASHGILPRIPDALAFARTTRVLLLVHESSAIELDVSFAELTFERELISRATPRALKGISFKLATAEDILIMKAIALRPRDIADIESILTVAPAVDLQRVRRILAEFSEALETRDFSGEFEAIVRRAKRDA